MTAPSYKTNDPKGWCGNPTRGAALGRPTVIEESSDYAGALTIRRVRIDSQGYDPNGTYYGLGEPLFWVANAEGTIDFTERAPQRSDMCRAVQARFPKAKLSGFRVFEQLEEALAGKDVRVISMGWGARYVFRRDFPAKSPPDNYVVVFRRVTAKDDIDAIAADALREVQDESEKYLNPEPA